MFKRRPQGFASHPEQPPRMGKALFQVKVVTVQGDTAISIRGAWEQALRACAGQLVFGVDAAFRLPENLHRNRRPPLILQEALVCRGVVGLDARLMARLELRRRAGKGELRVLEAPLDVEMRLHQVLIALALGADNRLMRNLQPPTHGLKVGRRVGAPTVGDEVYRGALAQTGGTRGPSARPRWLR